MTGSLAMTLHASRREFLKRAGALSVAGAAAPLALNLAALGEAAAASASDYKALVCVFLYGGNDYANTVVPLDTTSHELYRLQRPAVATPLDALAATALRNPVNALPDARRYALAPQLAPLVPLFDAGQLAVMLNVGTLVEPTTKDAYLRRAARLPPKLFSHNDQQSVYQSSGAEGSTTGWGGRIGDLFAAGNGNATFTCVSVAGSGVFLSGQRTVAYQVAPTGAVAVQGLKAPLFGSAACSNALRTLVTQPRSHLFENEHARIVQRAIEAEALLSPALLTAPPNPAFQADNPLAMQLAMVARIIAARAELGPKRQVFFVSLGGFDTHDGILETHPGLLATVGSALAAFQTAMADLALQDQVTSFTASDFGRTLNSDGDGSDHGWGSMHFALGGAVNGRNFYGMPPVPANDGPDDVGRGRLLPSMAVDQFGATLGRWFGVSDTDLDTVFPNLANFGRRDLGFMKPA
jgi:uncharacterized protein (DUF1501 family)